MREGRSRQIALPPDVAELTCGLNMPHAIPVARQPAGGAACWVQEIQFAADAVPVSHKDQVAVSGVVREEALGVKVRAVVCCGWCADCYDCEGCPGVTEVHAQASPLWAAVLHL